MPSLVRVVAPSVRHQNEFIAAARASRRLHAGFAHPPTTPESFREYIRKGRGSATRQHFLLARASGALVGVVNINEIVGGNFRSGYLGYFAFEPHARQGYMEAGLREIVSRSLRREGLHRLEANIQPSNGPSLALIRRLGFRHEGFSPRYLKIGGRWRDHERFAITREDLRGA